jgi:hypothetical protein
MAEPKSGANSAYIADALKNGDMDNPSEDARKRTGIGRGQTIASDYALDNVELAFSVPDATGKKMKGSCYDLSHSLSGASAVKE